MTRFPVSSYLPILASFGLVAALTPAVKALARAVGMVAQPKVDRWHKRPTALLGGVSIFVSVVAVTLASVPLSFQVTVVLSSSVFLFLLGLVDDFLALKPYQKLIGQIMGASPVVASGLTLPWTNSVAIDAALTIFWIVGITNAVNLLDNMDGLAAGVAAIASSFLAIHFYSNHQPVEGLLMTVFAAALAGFLLYNSNPASIFMGDCGSLFIGFFLASTALMSSSVGGRTRTFVPVLAVPVLTLFIPIFDTTFVMILRKLSGRAASQGGRDHTSHRLVALGMSERHAVWMLYGFAVLSGLLALLVRDVTLDLGLAVILSFTLALAFIGVHLAGVKVYDESQVRLARDQPLVAFLVDLSYKRRVFEVLLDVGLIVLSYYAAYVLVFGPVVGVGVREDFLRAIPVLVFLKLATFLAMGVYRGLWRYLSLDNLVVYAEAVVVGSAMSVLFLVFLFRFQGVSRTVIVLDALILFVMLAASRCTFRLLRMLIPGPTASEGRRVLIYGAGDAGELLARELRNNRGLRYLPVGFVDDDPLKKGKRIHGLRVFGGNGAFSRICEEQRVQEVLISSLLFSEERLDQIRRECALVNVTLTRLRFEIENLSQAGSRRYDPGEASEHPLPRSRSAQVEADPVEGERPS